ncbi:hypothetical protein R1sor_024491 [Riccia sorocarpa]|uniref:C-terminal of Roc (COR) domain-containing protein n=1 Tax=Riccia sorocarpa TaxID=122646 RepID=A0ABD3GTW7_9MARC
MESFDEESYVRRGATLAEWESVAHTLQSDTSIKSLHLFLTEEDPKILEIRGELWGRLLGKSQTLKRLSISLFTSASTPYLPALVSGLSLNPHPAIERLDISLLMSSSDTIYMSEIIRHTTKLQELQFSICSEEWLSEDAAGALALSLAAAVQLNLNTLNFRDCDPPIGVFEFLRDCDIFTGADISRRYLPELRVIIGLKMATLEGQYWGVFPFLAGSNISVILLHFQNHVFELEVRISWWKRCADALKSSSTRLIDIVVSKHYGKIFNPGYIQVRASRSLTSSLRIRVEDGFQARVFENYLPVAFFQQLFADKTRSSTSITKLALSNLEGVPGRWWKSVFDSLKSATSITSLDLSSCGLTDEDFEYLMSLLRVNYTIEEVLVQTSWRNDGKAAVIEEALARNKKLAREFSIMSRAGFELDQAKVGRIFFCGSPYAGKTQLKLRMMRLHHKSSTSASKPGKLSDMLLQRLNLSELRRTRGAEVEVLIDDEAAQVSLWDLAGQYIFRALHDLIFPRSSQSLIFVFTFNPFREDTRKKMKENVFDAFTVELEEWLKFIASNCHISGENEDVPQLFVVVTHRDRTEKHGPNCFECGPGSKVRKQIERFQSDFQDVVKLVPHVYHVDARAKKEVGCCLKDILESMSNWSERHRVPTVCSAVSSALIAYTKSSSSTSPVWSLPTFYKFCQSSTETLTTASPEIFLTIASYLHDVGRIIIVPGCTESENNEPLIIVDPNWCTEKFLGALITEGNHFDVHGGRCSESVVFTTSSAGFIDDFDFQSLLQKILDQMKDRQIEWKMLEDLLRRLDLCYRFEDGASFKYFIPIICGGLKEKCDIRRRELQWDDGHTEGCEYLGYRLHCEDTRRTSFNKAFFSRFQINCRQKLLHRFGIKGSNGGITCRLGLLKVLHDGYAVLVESDEVNGQHMDIMIKSSQQGIKNPRKRTQIIKFAQEHFLRELQAFCASSSGCRGIRLRVSVIRTSSVQKLVPMHERQEPQHCVELEELKRRFRSNIELNLQDMAGDVDEESLLNYQYTWPDGERELAKDTLGYEDLVDVLSQAQKEVMSSEKEVRTCSDELRQMLTKLSGESTSFSGPGISTEEGSCSVAAVDDNIELSEELKPLADFLGAKFDKVERKIDHLAHLTFSVQTELQQFKNHFHTFRAGLLEMQKVMTDVSSSIDKLIGYSTSREDHSCPRRPYFSHDGSDFLPKLKAYVLKGQAVRLHFLCEARNQPHVVQDQLGLPLVVTENDMSWVVPISKISLKLISTLISVGIHILAGVQVNPQVLHCLNLDTGERLPMSGTLLEYMKQNSGTIRVDPADPRVVKSWSLLQKYLGEKLNYREYRNTFGLCRVRYRYSSDPYAWICESCVEKGTKQKILDECPPT